MKVILEHVRVTENGDIVALGWALSESRPGIRHGVYVLLDHNHRILRALCDCEAFIYRKNCKHIEWVRSIALTTLGRVSTLQPS